MPLESATYIDSLNTSNPQETDPLSQSDDHIKLIKTVLKTTFPYITGQVTATHAQLNEAMVVPAILGTGGNATLNTGITQEEVKTAVGITDPAITTDGSTPSLASDITAEEVRTLISAAPSSTPGYLEIYPVGSVYLSVDASFNPTATFGGTWVDFGQGRMLLGIDPSNNSLMNTETAVPAIDTALTDASYTHTLTEAELPAHKHGTNIRFKSDDALVDGSLETVVAAANSAVDVQNTNLGGGGYQRTIGTDTTSVGSGTAFDLRPPYITVAMWKRTA